MGIFSKIFTWWDGATIGTAVVSAFKGEHVGTDAQGNRYYEAKDGETNGGYPRRWVTYNGVAEASRVPPEWHGWLHNTFDLPPTKEDYKPRAWEQPHVANMTGTPRAYRPKGSIIRGGDRPKATGDYEPWRPS